MRHPVSIVLLVTIAIAGCTPSIDDRVTATRGAEFFSENCAVCHGVDARGSDVTHPSGIRPPDLTRLAKRNGGTFPEIATMATVYGPAYHESRGTYMPQFGSGDLGPFVIVEIEDGIGTPIPADLVALTEYLQLIQR
jgi:mono/diheme cytochrome c family protein